MGKRATDETPKTKWDVLWIVLSNPKVIVFLLSLTGVSLASHSPAVRQYLPDFKDEVSVPISEDIHPEVRAKLESIISLLDEHTDQFDQIEKSIHNGDYAVGAQLQPQIDDLQSQIKAWHE